MSLPSPLPPPQFVTRSRELQIEDARDELSAAIVALLKTTSTFGFLRARRRCHRAIKNLDRLFG